MESPFTAAARLASTSCDANQKMKLLFCALALLLVAFGGPETAAYAQSQATSQSSTPPAGARFEVISSPLAVKWTFRLDRVTGRVTQLVATRDGDAKWEEMTVVGLPTLAENGRDRFQIFTSGLAVKWTFLIDTATGKTWQLQEVGAAGKPQQAWVPLAE